MFSCSAFPMTISLHLTGYEPLFPVRLLFLYRLPNVQLSLFRTEHLITFLNRNFINNTVELIIKNYAIIKSVVDECLSIQYFMGVCSIL